MSARAWSGSARHIPRRCAATTRSTRRRRAAGARRACLLHLRRRREISSPFRLLVHGRSGHGSAEHRRQRPRQGIGADPAHRRVSGGAAARPRDRGFLAAVTGSVPPSAEALETARAVDPAAAEILEPLLATTLSPTMISASDKRNVIPGLCDVTVDCRLLPGDSPERVEASAPRVAWPSRVRRCLADASGRYALAARHAVVVRDRDVRRAHGARRGCGAVLRGRLHGQPLAAAGVRCHLLRVLPDEGDGGRPRQPARPLCRRADHRCRPRARGRVPPSCCAGYRPIASLMPMAEEAAPGRHGARERRARPRADVVGGCGTD